MTTTPEQEPAVGQAATPVSMGDAMSSGRWGVFLSGLGFYKLSVKRRKQLTYVFFGSLAAHVIALLMFGGWIIMRSRKENATIFKTPPPSRTYEPRKLEHKVKVQKRQRSSSRPSMMPRIVSMKLSDLALPEIKVDPKIIRTTFQPKFKAVSGKGLGAGLGTGYGTDGFGMGISSFNFFGIHGRGERVAILVDVSISMVEDERGGPDGYLRVKQRLNEVVEALSEGSLFNVFVFADGGSGCFPQMVIGNNDNKKKAKLFLRPYNTEGNYGLTSGNLASSSAVGLQAAGGTTRLDIVLTSAYVQGADTILIISDGVPQVKKRYSPEQMQAFQSQQQKWAMENAARLQTWDRGYAAAAPAEVASEKVWIPEQPARPAVPPRPPSKQGLKEGAPVDKGSPGIPARPAIPGHWAVRSVTRGGYGGAPRPKPPEVPEPGWWTLSDFCEHLRILYENYYVKQGKKEPIIHAIGYQIDKDGHAFLEGLARQFRGKYRRVRQLKDLN